MPRRTPDHDQRASLYTRIGWIVTAAWVFVALSWVIDDPSRLTGLKAGEFGDFATGATGPLAFLWLVVGYYLQREELRLQRKEIELQRKEMAKSTRQLAEQARAISANEEHARRDVFMRVSDLYISHLNDITRNILQRMNRDHLGYAEEEYDHGSKSAYFEHIVTIARDGNEREQFTRRMEQLKQNPAMDVTGLMLHYCEAFESIILQARLADQDGLLRKYYLSSRMGAAYFLICEIVGRDLNILVDHTADMLPDYTRPLQLALLRNEARNAQNK